MNDLPRFFSLFLILILTACAGVSTEDTPLALRPAKFRDLKGWEHDDVAKALTAFRKSCARIMKKDPQQAFGPIGGYYGDWQPICREAEILPDAQARYFFETRFQPWQARAGFGEKGLFTGYYEASLKGSRQRGGSYQTPLRRRPGDLVMVNLGDFREDLKGRRIAGRVKGGYLKPYEDRAEISNGKLADDETLALAWVDDPVDAFFLQIQGSGVVDLAEGGQLRVGYDGQNGHPYYAIGRELVKREELDKEDVSMQSIRAWLEANPGKAQEIMNTNASYIFFRALDGDGPLGGEGIALTPGRSLAVDRSKIPYGIPAWVDLEAPVDSEPPVRRLMIAQDTGGAIRGAVRGDVFWGHGSRAEYLAGHMKSEGRYWFLLPRAVSLLKSE